MSESLLLRACLETLGWWPGVHWLGHSGVAEGQEGDLRPGPPSALALLVLQAASRHGIQAAWPGPCRSPQLTGGHGPERSKHSPESTKGFVRRWLRVPRPGKGGTGLCCGSEHRWGFTALGRVTERAGTWWWRGQRAQAGPPLSGGMAECSWAEVAGCGYLSRPPPRGGQGGDAMVGGQGRGQQEGPRRATLCGLRLPRGGGPLPVVGDTVMGVCSPGPHSGPPAALVPVAPSGDPSSRTISSEAAGLPLPGGTA